VQENPYTNTVFFWGGAKASHSIGKPSTMHDFRKEMTKRSSFFYVRLKTIFHKEKNNGNIENIDVQN
jgi:hypothetical protein